MVGLEVVYVFLFQTESVLNHVLNFLLETWILCDCLFAKFVDNCYFVVSDYILSKID